MRLPPSIPLINLGRQPVSVERGMRIAQLVFQRVEQVEIVEVTELPASERGAGGFGSTGVSAAPPDPGADIGGF